LKNFEQDHYEIALNVLKYINFFDDFDVIEALNNGFRRIIENLTQQSEIYILSIGNYGKSGSAMMYFLHKTDAFKYKNRIQSTLGHVLNHSYNIVNRSKELIELINKSHSNNKVVIMIDDFFGTGDSVIDFYYGLKNGRRQTSLIDFHSKFQKLPVYPDIKFLSVVAMSSAVEKITRKIHVSTVCCGNVFHKAFDTKKGSVFGYRGKSVPLRKVIYTYGEQIYNAGPLGYKNSQSLVVFSYGAPNNTLPIIWSEQDWQPIFPRFYKHKMEKAKQFRRNTAHHLSLGLAIGIKNIDRFQTGKRDLGWKKFNFVKKTDFLLFSLIKLLRKQRSRIVICQTLGILSDEYDELINKAKQMGILDTNEDLTKEGYMLYYEVVKQIEKIKKISRASDKQPVMYVPNSFEGNT